MSLRLQREALLGEPYLYLSAYFNEYGGDYPRLLNGVRTHGDRETWLHFFLRGLWRQAQEAHQRGRKLIALRREYTDRYQDHRSPYIVALTRRLFENPYINATEAQQALDCSRQTAFNLFEVLEDDDVLIAVESGGSNSLFYAKEIYEVLDKPVA